MLSTLGSGVNLDIVLALLQRIFFADDPVTIRPIETWTEDGRRKQRVLYQHIRHMRLRDFDSGVLSDLIQIATAERANLFFGVCPRFAPFDGYDRSWQIRTVRCLWSDIDNCSPAEAVHRCATTGLPHPSVVVATGSGVHLYWVLDRPCLIDDAGDPPQVQIEGWVNHRGRKRPVDYIVRSGEKLYLTNPKTGRRISQNLPSLSPKAVWLQDLLKGISHALGGDCTTDLARLLRLSGTWNRKDERNGRELLPCLLSEASGSVYSLSQFASFERRSPAFVRREQLRTVRLPTVRKRVAPTKQDKLNTLLAQCSAADPGERSEADFALCCYAIENGIGREHVFEQAAGVGKFAERAQDYFDLTWSKAEERVRKRLFARTSHRTTKRHSAPRETQPLVYDPAAEPVGVLLGRITACLRASGVHFSRAGQLVEIRTARVSYVTSTSQLAAAVNERTELLLKGGSGSRYEPLPAKYAKTWLSKQSELAKLPQIKVFSRNPVYTADDRLVGEGFDHQSGIYCCGPSVEPRANALHLNTLLEGFCFETIADRSNYVAMLLTIVLVPKFVGSMPGVLLAGNQPLIGKTILAQIIAILRDGKPAATCSYIKNDEELEKRIASRVKSGASTIIIDNAKSKQGSAQVIESACLERCLTDSELSFRLLGTSDEIRAENSLTFCITANTPEVGQDLLTRCVPVHLHYEGDPAKRKFTIPDPEGYVEEHRAEILGELCGMVERARAAGSPEVETFTRFNKKGWGNVIGGILEANGFGEFLKNANRSATVFDTTRREFGDLVATMILRLNQPLRPADWAAVAESNALLRCELGTGSGRSKAIRMGFLLSRFVGEDFDIMDSAGCVHRVKLRKQEYGNNKLYWLEWTPRP